MSIPLALPYSVKASCSAPASLAESSTPNTVTFPALPLPGVGGSVVDDVAAPPPAVVVAAAVVPDPPPAVVAGAPSLLLLDPHAAARNTEAIGIAASLSQPALIDFPLLCRRARARSPCKRFHTER